MKKYDQRSHTCFLAKYIGLSLRGIDMETRYSIDDIGIHLIKGHRYSLIDNPDHPDGNLTNHEHFCIHDDLFGIILETDQNYDITLKVIHNEP